MILKSKMAVYLQEASNGISFCNRSGIVVSSQLAFFEILYHYMCFYFGRELSFIIDNSLSYR